MYINVLAILMLLIASMTIYNGYRWATQSKKDNTDITLGCIQMVLGGLLMGIVYFTM